MDAHGEATRDRTMVRALGRLGTLERVARARDAAAAADDDGDGTDAHATMRVLCLGADRHEGTNPQATARAFVGVREAALRAGVETVSVLCVGPNVKVDDGVELDVVYDVRDGMSASSSVADVPARAALQVEYRTGLYHDEAAAATHSDVAFAFNAGVWGYDPSDWAPTIERVVIDECTPLVVTSYTLLEAESDEEAMRLSLSAFNNVEWVWQPEMNPSRSTEVRDLGFDRADYISSDKDSSALKENSAWQCVAVSG